jgi:hypothetical protein
MVLPMVQVITMARHHRRPRTCPLLQDYLQEATTTLYDYPKPYRNPQ